MAPARESFRETVERFIQIFKKEIQYGTCKQSEGIRTEKRKPNENQHVQ